MSDPIPAKSELARELTILAKKGPPEALAARLTRDPSLALARIDDGICIRSMLHLATDWPGKREHAAANIKLLVEAGCDPNVRAEGPHGETALHWAASSDDVPAIDALVKCGADLEIDGAVIGGGTAMADAVAFGKWEAAARLLDLGATTNFWQAAGLGLVEQVTAEVISKEPDELTDALWVAASGGRRNTAEVLLKHGADPQAVRFNDQTASQAARASGHNDLAEWIDGLEG